MNPSNASVGKKRRKKSIIFIFVVSIFLLLIIHIEPSRMGKICDLKSGEPLNNVIAFRELEMITAGPGGGVSSFLGADEAVSNVAGIYFLPLRINFHFPILSHVETRYTFVKAGYFPINNVEQKSAVTVMRKKEFYFDFMKVEDFSPFSNLFFGDFIEKSKNYHRYSNESYQLRLNNLAPPGQIFRREGSRFSKLFMIPFEEYFYVFDDASQSWLKLNDRGEVLLDKSPKLPVCEMLASPLRSGDMIFLKDGKIHLPKNSFVFENNTVFNEKDYTAQSPSFNKISDICHGAQERIMTIEGDGTMLCEFFLRGSYPQKMVPGRAWNVETLLSAEQGVIPVSSRLRIIQFPSTYYYYLLANAGENWSIYRIDPKMGRNYPPVCLGRFQSAQNISAAFFTFESLYLALEGEGVHRFVLPSERKYENKDFYEDPGFLENFHKAKIDTVHSIATGYSISGNFLYMTNGGDTVYRFSKTGIPDRKVGIIEK